GLAAIRALGDTAADRIVTAREAGGPYRDLAELARRADLDTTRLEALAGAGGVTFLSLEDESGMLNVVVTPRPVEHSRARALLVRGTLDTAGGAIGVTADRLQPLDPRVGAKSRDFR
ncbi:MAG: error-prone DNA polymerase, partial [Saccharothrix sp.]|nr:error-prone DNA polymerase [Saccharothrix sp.]